MPNLNELRALSVTLPPSERASGAEAADLVSAVIAVAHYGEELLDAAREGKVADYFHDRAVAHAQEHGHDEPVRGNVPAEGAPPVTPVNPGQQTIDYDKLAQAIVRAQQSSEDPQPDTTAPQDAANATPADVAAQPDTSNTGATAQPSTTPIV